MVRYWILIDGQKVGEYDRETFLTLEETEQKRLEYARLYGVGDSGVKVLKANSKYDYGRAI